VRAPAWGPSRASGGPRCSSYGAALSRRVGAGQWPRRAEQWEAGAGGPRELKHTAAGGSGLGGERFRQQQMPSEHGANGSGAAVAQARGRTGAQASAGVGMALTRERRTKPDNGV
jgi:hypothetical protein